MKIEKIIEAFRKLTPEDQDYLLEYFSRQSQISSQERSDTTSSQEDPGLQETD